MVEVKRMWCKMTMIHVVCLLLFSLTELSTAAAEHEQVVDYSGFVCAVVIRITEIYDNWRYVSSIRGGSLDNEVPPYTTTPSPKSPYIAAVLRGQKAAYTLLYTTTPNI